MASGSDRNPIKRIDANSIKTTTLFSFVMFAMILISFLWVLTSFFLDTYYQRVRTQEVIRTASSIETQYRRDERIIRFLTFAMDKDAVAYAEKRRANWAAKKNAAEKKETNE